MPKITELPGKQEKGDIRMSEFKPITTQEEFDAAIKARLAREKEKFSDYDQLKSYVEELEKEKAGLESSKQSAAEYDKKIAEFESRVAGYETADLRTRIALQNGLPYDLADRLQGTDEESLKADAERLAGFMKPVSKVAPVKSTEPIVPKEDDDRAMVRNLVQNLNIED